MFDIEIQFLKNPPLSTRKSMAVVDKGGKNDIIRYYKPFEMGMQGENGGKMGDIHDTKSQGEKGDFSQDLK